MLLMFLAGAEPDVQTDMVAAPDISEHPSNPVLGEDRAGERPAN